MAKADTTPLTEIQREMMEIVWQREEVTVSEVRDALSAQRPLARNTVQTMLVRLEEKGWLKHREQGRTFVYSANRPRTVSLAADEAERIRAMIEAAETEPKQKPKRQR